jgi:hypothetical protein
LDFIGQTESLSSPGQEKKNNEPEQLMTLEEVGVRVPDMGDRNPSSSYAEMLIAMASWFKRLANKAGHSDETGTGHSDEAVTGHQCLHLLEAFEVGDEEI